MRKYSYALLITLFALTGASFAASADKPITIHVNQAERFDENTSLWNGDQLIPLYSGDNLTVKSSKLNKLGIEYGHGHQAFAYCKVNRLATTYELDVVKDQFQPYQLNCNLTAIK